MYIEPSLFFRYIGYKSNNIDNGFKMKNVKQFNLSITHHLLLAQFGNRVLTSIEEIAEDYLGLAISTVKKRAWDGSLPFPVFRMGESQKSPWLVHIDDLAQYIDQQVKIARAEWKLLNK